MTWDDELTEEQRVHASHGARILRLVAGPGTGKTRVMTRRVAYLVEEAGIAASSILALTFSRAALQGTEDQRPISEEEMYEAFGAKETQQKLLAITDALNRLDAADLVRELRRAGKAEWTIVWRRQGGEPHLQVR
jgi:hypothetical protein